MSNNNWISINEQKPPDGQEVIILYNGEPRIAVRTDDYFWDLHRKNRFWYLTNRLNQIKSNALTTNIG